MSRIMLLCPEPLGHGQPAGVGIRFIEMARVLRDDGHEVTVLSPDAGAIEGCKSDFIHPASLAGTSESSDAAVVQGHVANAFFQQAAPIPTVVDLYDPYIIENLHYFAERGGEVFEHDHLTLMMSLARGDFFLCASEAQRMFYLGALLATGRLNPVAFENDPDLESLIAIAPFGVPAPRELGGRASRPLAPGILPGALQRRRGPAEAGETPAPLERIECFDILFGGIYDWYDPILAIEAVALARESLPNATLTFTHHPNPELTPQGKLAEAMAHARERSYDFVRFEPWAPYASRAEFFERFALALITFPRSVETDLSMRTRIYDYLWCGLPIVTSSAPGTDEILERYGAGSVISRRAATGVAALLDEGPQAFATEIVSILRDSQRYESMTRGALEFVRDHQWERTLAPLREFCRAPRVDATKEAFAARQSIPERPISILDRLKRRLRSATGS